MRYRLQRHDGTDCSATMVPITVLRMVPIQRYRHILSDLFRLNNRAPTTGFHTKTKSPSRSFGDMESLGIRKDANTNTCAKIQNKKKHVHTNAMFVIISNHLLMISSLFISNKSLHSYI